MNGNNHLLFGTSLNTMIVLNLDKVNMLLPNISMGSETATLFILGGVLGGVFPDIDNPKSHIGQLTKPISSIIGEISASFGHTGRWHRGIFHDMSIYIVLLIFCYYNFPYLCGFLIGCLSHIFLDCFNPSGIPIFLGVKHIHLGKIYADSKGAIIFSWLCTISCIIVGIYIFLL